VPPPASHRPDGEDSRRNVVPSDESEPKGSDSMRRDAPAPRPPGLCRRRPCLRARRPPRRDERRHRARRRRGQADRVRPWRLKGRGVPGVRRSRGRAPAEPAGRRRSPDPTVTRAREARRPRRSDHRAWLRSARRGPTAPPDRAAHDLDRGGRRRRSPRAPAGPHGLHSPPRHDARLRRGDRPGAPWRRRRARARRPATRRRGAGRGAARHGFRCCARASRRGRGHRAGAERWALLTARGQSEPNGQLSAVGKGRQPDLSTRGHGASAVTIVRSTP
jgi:hypothetical protein